MLLLLKSIKTAHKLKHTKLDIKETGPFIQWSFYDDKNWQNYCHAMENIYRHKLLYYILKKIKLI